MIVGLVLSFIIPLVFASHCASISASCILFVQSHSFLLSANLLTLCVHIYVLQLIGRTFNVSIPGMHNNAVSFPGTTKICKVHFCFYD